MVCWTGLDALPSLAAVHWSTHEDRQPLRCHRRSAPAVNGLLADWPAAPCQQSVHDRAVFANEAQLQFIAINLTAQQAL